MSYIQELLQPYWTAIEISFIVGVPLPLVVVTNEIINGILSHVLILYTSIKLKFGLPGCENSSWQISQNQYF